MSTNHNQETATTREQLKNEEREQQKLTLKELRKNKMGTRLIPIWLRIVIVTFLAFLCIIIGAVFGYSVIGDGKVSEVFQKSTWTHIWDLVEKEK